MAKVFVEGDLDALDEIQTALRAAGLESVDIELVARPRPVSRFPAAPGNWAAFADMAADLPYAEWRDEVMGLVNDGAMAVRGNHDNAISTPSETMNAEAQAAIEWTRGRLSAAQRRFLAELPMTLQEEGRLYVHSEASHPARWRYVASTADAARSLEATDADVTFCGHIHLPSLYSMSAAAKMTSFVPTPGVPVQLLGGRRWLAVLGSVGQPRDRNPAASFAMLDTETREITYCRVPYDVEAAAQRIRDNGLPLWLADRLMVGR